MLKGPNTVTSAPTSWDSPPPGLHPRECPKALEHPHFAIAESGDMKLQPAPERAPRHKDILKAYLPPTAATRFAR